MAKLISTNDAMKRHVHFDIAHMSLREVQIS